MTDAQDESTFLLRMLREAILDRSEESDGPGSAASREEELVDPHVMDRRFCQIRQALDTHVVAQEEAKDCLAMVATEHECRVALPEGWPRVVLLVGPTGCGKTELARALAKTMSVPFFRFDAAEMSHTSFHGRQLSDILDGLLRDARAKKHRLPQTGILEEPSGRASKRNDHHSASHGVVMIDELDKIAFVQENRAKGTQERHFEAVQSTLLPLFEGKKIPVSRDNQASAFDTSRLLLLAGGSFSNPEVAKIVKEREGTRMSSSHGHWPLIQHEDLIRFGFLPELVGRIRAIVPVERLNTQHYSEIISRDLSRAQFAALGCRVFFEPGVVEALARRAGELNLGARAVGIILERVRLHIFRRAEGIEVKFDEKSAVVTMKYVNACWKEEL